MRGLIFTPTFVCNVTHFENSSRYDHKHILVFTLSTRYSKQVLMKL